jgi:uncharacterized protein (DUF362 family)
VEQVYLAECSTYEVDKIAEALRKAVGALGVDIPKGEAVFLKPNCEWAHPKYAPSAYTHPQVLRAACQLLDGNSLTIGENSITGFPTRFSFRKADYNRLAKECRAELLAIDEAVTTTVDLSRATVHRRVELPSRFLQSRFFVAIPKLKPSVYTPFSGALQLDLGLLQKGVMVLQHERLPEKIVDLLEVASPQLVIVDAIEVGEGVSSLTCRPKPFGALIVGTNAIAVDAIIATILGFKPSAIDFLSLAHERGYGPIDRAEIGVIGDIAAEELAKRAALLEHRDPRPENWPLPPQVRIAVGSPYHLTGTAGALTEFLSLLDRGGIALKGARETTIVIGRAEEILTAKTDTAALILLGDSAHAKYQGFTRIVRLRGDQILTRQLLDNLPFAMRLPSPKDEFMTEFTIDSLLASFSRWWNQRSGPKDLSQKSPGFRRSQGLRLPILG